MVWSQQSTCLLVIASSNTTAICFSINVSICTMETFTGVKLGAVRILLGTFFSPSGRRNLQRWTQPFQACTSSERFSAEAAYTTDMYVLIYLLLFSQCTMMTALCCCWFTLLPGQLLCLWMCGHGKKGAMWVGVCVLCGVSLLLLLLASGSACLVC